MAETSNYECAAEIADAIRRVPENLAGELAGELAAQLMVNLSRPLLAAAVAGEVVREHRLAGLGTLSRDRLAFAVARLWELVDAIDQGDTARRRGSSPATPRAPETPYPDKSAADLEGGINLADPDLG